MARQLFGRQVALFYAGVQPEGWPKTLCCLFALNVFLNLLLALTKFQGGELATHGVMF